MTPQTENEYFMRNSLNKEDTFIIKTLYHSVAW